MTGTEDDQLAAEIHQFAQRRGDPLGLVGDEDLADVGAAVIPGFLPDVAVELVRDQPRMEFQSGHHRTETHPAVSSDPQHQGGGGG